MHTVEIAEIFSHFFDKNFVKATITRDLISRNIFSVMDFFCFFHTVMQLSLAK